MGRERLDKLSIMFLTVGIAVLATGCPMSGGIGGGGGSGGGEMFWVKLQAVVDRPGATAKVYVNGSLKDSSSSVAAYQTCPQGCTYTTKYPLGTVLKIQVTSGQLNYGSEIFIWNENQQVVVYNTRRDGLGDTGITYTIHYSKNGGLTLEEALPVEELLLEELHNQ